MRKLVLFTAASLDGFIATTNGEVSWLFSDQDYGYTAFYKRVDTVIMGRKTYDTSLSFGDYPYSEKAGFVFSRSGIASPEKSVEVISRNIEGFVGGLKSRSGGTIWLVGGGEIIRLLLNARLIDQIILSLHPVMLGEGVPLSGALTDPVKMTLSGNKRFESGLVQLVYDLDFGLSPRNLQER